MALPAFREAAVAGGAASSSSATATFAHAAQAGELLFACATWQDDAAAPALVGLEGWTLAASDDGSTTAGYEHVALYWRVADAPLASLVAAFTAPVRWPYLALLGYTIAGVPTVANGQADAGHRQNASSDHTYGGLVLASNNTGSLVLYCVAFQHGTDAVARNILSPLGDVRAQLDQLWVLDGALGAPGQNVTLGLDIATAGTYTWSAVACEVTWSSAAPFRPRGMKFVPDRVYGDQARRPWQPGLGVPPGRS